MRVTTSGQVSINTTSGTSRLTVVANAVDGNVPALLIQTSGGVAYGTCLGLETTGGTDSPTLAFKAYNSGTPAYYAIANNAGALTFNSNGWSTSAGTERMRIDSSGNVGIGTASPYSVANYTGLTINGTNGGTFSLFTNGTRSFTAYSSSGAVVLGSVTSVPLVFTTADTERMRIDSSGNVGIGTTSPNKQLSIGSSGLSTLGFTWTGDNLAKAGIETNHLTGEVKYNAFTNYFPTFYSNNTERMRIDASGTLFVGATSTPNSVASKLTVLGQTFLSTPNTAISSSTWTTIATMNAGLATIRDQSNGGTCLVLFDANGGTTLAIISQVGSTTAYTLSAPSAAQIQLRQSGAAIQALGGSSRNGTLVSASVVAIA